MRACLGMRTAIAPSSIAPYSVSRLTEPPSPSAPPLALHRASPQARSSGCRARPRTAPSSPADGADSHRVRGLVDPGSDLHTSRPAGGRGSGESRRGPCPSRPARSGRGEVSPCCGSGRVPWSRARIAARPPAWRHRRECGRSFLARPGNHVPPSPSSARRRQGRRHDAGSLDPEKAGVAVASRRRTRRRCGRACLPESPEPGRRPPMALHRGRALEASLSLSHHGRFVAFAGRAGR